MATETAQPAGGATPASGPGHLQIEDQIRLHRAMLLMSVTAWTAETALCSAGPMGPPS
jgi:hypothetical protein